MHSFKIFNSTWRATKNSLKQLPNASLLLVLGFSALAGLHPLKCNLSLTY